MSVRFQYTFHPVGQGLFASGCLYDPNKPQPKFVWVYDCGTRGRRRRDYWTAKMNDLQLITTGRTHVDLLILSHFDDDHIAGVTELLKHFRVETLLLPYIPLWQRLLIAFSRGLSPGGKGFEYLFNPVGFLREIGGGNLERIVFVGPDDNDNLPLPDGFPFEPSQEDRPWRIKIPSIRLDDSPESDFEHASEAEYLPSGRPILVEGFWEFCPYNAPLKVGLGSSFREKVEELRDHLLNEANQEERKVALADLKKLFESRFTTGKQRNEISLFLYAGPIYSTWKGHELVVHEQIYWGKYHFRYPCYYPLPDWAPDITEKCSILYTGDGYLSKAAEFNGLHRKITPQRMDKLGVVQVPHHGSKANWHSTLAKKLKPQFSVFSSDPERGPTYHPDKEVLRDFWPYSPIQVNITGISFFGWLI